MKTTTLTKKSGRKTNEKQSKDAKQKKAGMASATSSSSEKPHFQTAHYQKLKHPAIIKKKIKTMIKSPAIIKIR